MGHTQPPGTRQGFIYAVQLNHMMSDINLLFITAMSHFIILY
jgi:hypothetical protein